MSLHRACPSHPMWQRKQHLGRISSASGPAPCAFAAHDNCPQRRTVQLECGEQSFVIRPVAAETLHESITARLWATNLEVRMVDFPANKKERLFFDHVAVFVDWTSISGLLWEFESQVAGLKVLSTKRKFLDSSFAEGAVLSFLNSLGKNGLGHSLCNGTKWQGTVDFPLFALSNKCFIRHGTGHCLGPINFGGVSGGRHHLHGRGHTVIIFLCTGSSFGGTASHDTGNGTLARLPKFHVMRTQCSFLLSSSGLLRLAMRMSSSSFLFGF